MGLRTKSCTHYMPRDDWSPFDSSYTIGRPFLSGKKKHSSKPVSRPLWLVCNAASCQLQSDRLRALHMHMP